jgi:PilZ domain
VKERDGITERRRHQRFGLEVEVMVRTDRELLPGRTQEISEAGMSAILPVQLAEGDKVELQIRLPSATASTHAIVRDRNVFRHGFEFVQPLHGIVGNQAVTGDCETCAGTGSVLRALVGGEGVAFAQLKCPECGGTGLKRQ